MEAAQALIAIFPNVSGAVLEAPRLVAVLDDFAEMGEAVEQRGGHLGVAALLGSLPAAEWLIANRGYDADWFREALKDKGIRPCIPGRKSRGRAVRYDKCRYKRRNRIEIMFDRLKDRRRIATRYDRCPRVFLSAVALAATDMFWL